MTTAHDVIRRRRAERSDLLDRARAFATQLPDVLGVRAVVVFGSVARGDFHDSSDIDVLVVAEHLPAGIHARYRALGELGSLIEPIPWTPAEWLRQRARRNPVAVEADDVGVWLVGSSADLADILSRRR